eukprot:jgi/Mesvir1/27549/Mv07303-RA.1
MGGGPARSVATRIGSLRLGSGAKLEAVPFYDVTIQDRFWSQRQEVNRNITAHHCLEMVRKAGGLTNFELARDNCREGHKGPVFIDSDLYKTLEGVSYTLHGNPNPALEKSVDDILELVASAQLDTGYIDTWFQVRHPEAKFTNLRDWHELYCAGHMFEAAVAHYNATGKSNFLSIALKYAELINATFGPGLGTIPGYGGHPEIELALMKLWKATGDEKWFMLARVIVERRGSHYFAFEHGTPEDEYDGTYWLDDVPIRQHKSVKGHAVRAGYLFAGAADVARVTDDGALGDMLDTVWASAVERRVFITGGIGPSAANEGFTVDYDLPNETAYQETCATCAMAMWGHRMGLLRGDASYVDAVEMALYNGVLSGVSLSGRTFFYTNPLASAGDRHRYPWFPCACCPPNVLRTVATLGGYAYAVGSHTGGADAENRRQRPGGNIGQRGGLMVTGQRLGGKSGPGGGPGCCEKQPGGSHLGGKGGQPFRGKDAGISPRIRSANATSSASRLAAADGNPQWQNAVGRGPLNPGMPGAGCSEAMEAGAKRWESAPRGGKSAPCGGKSAPCGGRGFDDFGSDHVTDDPFGNAVGQASDPFSTVGNVGSVGNVGNVGMADDEDDDDLVLVTKEGADSGMAGVAAASVASARFDGVDHPDEDAVGSNKDDGVDKGGGAKNDDEDGVDDKDAGEDGDDVDSFYVNLYVAGSVRATLPGGQAVEFRVTTDYPWDGQVQMEALTGGEFRVMLRRPGWCRDASLEVVPAAGGPDGEMPTQQLEQQQQQQQPHQQETSNMQSPHPGGCVHELQTRCPTGDASSDTRATWPGSLPAPARPETKPPKPSSCPPTIDGYWPLSRVWAPGDLIRLDMDMPPVRVRANPQVKDDIGRAAVQRGPLIYCAEQADNPDLVLSRVVAPLGAPLKASFQEDLLGGVVAIDVGVEVVDAMDWDQEGMRLYQPAARRAPAALRMVPYAYWANRVAGAMVVWLPCVDPA